MAIKVFRTSVKNEKEASLLKKQLAHLLGSGGSWNFDLEDCDKILRVHSHPDFNTESLILLLSQQGFYCEEL